MDITVAICTWNRAASLAATLDSCAALVPTAACDWELLVVDNNSTDETPDTVASYADRLPLRYVFEARQGLSSARNRAVAEARGKVILWTDDDVLVAPGWLAAYADGIRRHPQATFFGGPILPRFAAAAPDWLVANLAVFQDALALRQIGESRPIAELSDVPNGANMAMRRDALRQHLFDPSLGRSGTALLGGEETAIFEQLLAAGLTGYWLGDAPVHHVIPPERMTVDYIRAYFASASRISLMRRPESERQRLSRKAAAWRCRLLWETWRVRLSRRHDSAWARALVATARLEGRIAAVTAGSA